MPTDNIRAELEELSVKVPKAEDVVATSEESIDRALKWEDYIGKKQDREQRKQFAGKLYWFLSIYMACVFLLLLLSGFRFIPFTLNEAVLLAMLGTTTANVVSIFIVVAKYLFPANK